MQKNRRRNSTRTRAHTKRNERTVEVAINASRSRAFLATVPASWVKS